MTVDDVLPDQVNERMPVWMALSELFLDTELREVDHDRIAAVLAASPYSVEKIEEILCCELTPVLKWNLRSVAGEWAGFNEQWLIEKITPRIDRRPLIRFGVFSMLREEWKDIRNKVAACRTGDQTNL